MQPPSQIDVLVIGGGPAGLATAIELASRDYGVLVIDRATPPIDKPCGEGLMPDGVLRLEELGVELSADQRAPFRGIRYIEGELRAEARFQEGTGFGVRRPVLHAALCDRAREVGVAFQWQTVVRGLTDEGVETDRGEIEARWTIGADGLRSRVRSWAGLAAPSVGPKRFGVRRHYRCPPWSDLVEVYWSDGCEAYVTPVSREMVGVAILWSGSKTGFDGLLTNFPELMSRLEGAAVTGSDLGTGPFDQRCSSVYRKRVALVGDAAGYRDAITGEGMSLALHQASALADAISVGDLAQYQRAVRGMTALPFRLIGLLLIAERRPWLRHRLLATLAHEPALFSRLLAIHARQRPVRELGAGGLLRLARGLLSG
jgi:flavin-dependent dehydrogenase